MLLVERTIETSGIGKRLKGARKRAGLSVEHAAEALGRSSVMLWRYETEQTPVRVEDLQKMAQMYGTTVAYLAGETDKLQAASTQALAIRIAELPASYKAIVEDLVGKFEEISEKEEEIK